MSDALRELAERAGVPPAVAEHYGPLVQLLLAALPSTDGRPPDEVAGAVRSAVSDGLHPDHAYSPEQAAAFLGIERTSVLKVSKALLPRVRSGRILGIDLMAYRGDVTPQEAAAYKEAQRDRVRTGPARRRPPASRVRS